MLEITVIALLIISCVLLFLLLKKSKQLKTLNLDLKKTHKILDSINIPIFYKNKEGKFIGSNKAFDKSFSNFKQQAIDELKEFKLTSTQEIEFTYDNDIKKPTLIYFTNYVDGGIGALVDISNLTKEKKRVFQKYEELNFAVQGSNDGHWMWDTQSNQITLSKRAKEILGYSENEKPPETMIDWMNLVESYDISKTNEALASHLDGRSPFINVDHRLKISLEEIWVNIRGKGVYSENNLMTKVYGTIRDISDQKRELTNIIKQKNLYMTFMDKLPALSFIKDKDGKYIYVNDFYQKLLGFKTWKNKKAEDLFVKHIADQIKESDREALYEGINKHEEIITDEEGSYRIFETYKFPIDSEKEKVLCGFGLDISKEQIYKEKIDLYTKVIQNIKEGIIITNSKGVIISVNKAFTSQTGYMQQDIIGKKTSIRKSGKHSEKFYENLWKELVATGTWSGEIFNKNKDGTIVQELLTINAIKNKRSRLTNYIGIYESIKK